MQDDTDFLLFRVALSGCHCAVQKLFVNQEEEDVEGNYQTISLCRIGIKHYHVTYFVIQADE